jgi:hypothetical protein
VDEHAADRILSVWLNSGTAAKPGAARYQIYSGRATTGSVTLAAADRHDLIEGGMLVRFYQASGHGVIDAPLSLRR